MVPSIGAGSATVPSGPPPSNDASGAGVRDSSGVGRRPAGAPVVEHRQRIAAIDACAGESCLR